MARTTRTKQLKVPQGPVEFTLPHKFLPRSYQRDVFVAFEAGVKRFVLCWHRRSGKDRTCLNLITTSMAYRPGLYLYIYPTKVLAKEALWKALYKDGKFLDAFPPGMLAGDPNNTEMMLETITLPGHATGSIFKVTGADDPDSLRGLNPVGVVLSEYSQHQENVWDEIISPILNENAGWVIFNFTPQGKNHAWKIYQTALANPARWFCSRKTVDDTTRDAPGEDGSWVVSPSTIQQERTEGREEEIIQQESYCSFDGYQVGTILGDVLRRCLVEGRVRPVVRSASEPVGVCLDIGISDGTAGIFWQNYGKEIQIIDYEFTQGKSHADWWKLLDSKPYVYGKIILPHDAKSKFFGQEQTVFQFFQGKFRCQVLTAEKLGVQERINMTRAKFSVLVFDKDRCARVPGPRQPSLLEALGNWRRPYNKERADYSGDPVHDINSHAADALTYGVVGGMDGMTIAIDVDKLETHAEMEWNPYRALDQRSEHEWNPFGTQTWSAYR